MQVGIVSVDSKIPNLALMKLSAYHKAEGDSVRRDSMQELISKVPPMKAEAMINITQQLLKVQEEVDEAIQAPKEQFIEELGDLIHAVIVLTRVMENEGINPARALERVIEKNHQRGYYDEPETAEEETFSPLVDYIREAMRRGKCHEQIDNHQG